jgi:hypothetical protein
MNYKEGGYKVTKEEVINYDLKIQEAVAESIKDLREKCSEKIFHGILGIILKSGKHIKNEKELYDTVAMYIPDISKENIANVKNDVTNKKANIFDLYNLQSLSGNIGRIISFRLGLNDGFTKPIVGRVDNGSYLNTFIKETEKQIKKELGI